MNVSDRRVESLGGVLLRVVLRLRDRGELEPAVDVVPPEAQQLALAEARVDREEDRGAEPLRDVALTIPRPPIGCSSVAAPTRRHEHETCCASGSESCTFPARIQRPADSREAGASARSARWRVEAGGIEPPSEGDPPRATTCVAHVLLSRLRLPMGRILSASRTDFRSPRYRRRQRPSPKCVALAAPTGAGR